MSVNVELTVFTNKRGRLSKSLSVDAGGNLVKEPMGSLFEGTAQRYRLPNGAKSLADLFDKMQAPHALALGRLRADIPDKSPITIKGKEYQGAVTRTGDNILYEPSAPAFLLVDLDTKGCPPEIVARLKAEGLVSLLAGIVPAITATARVQRSSTSSGLYRTDTQQKFADSDGQHLYILVQDGADIPRALAVLFKRVWLAGLGWIALSKSGATLKRGVIDAAVDAPERLVFEGAPQIKPPLAQDTAARKAIVTMGKALDTSETLPDLDAEEEAEFERLVKAAKAKIAPEAVRVEREYKNKEAEKVAKERNIPVEKARTLVEKRMGGVLMGSDTIEFAYRASATVAEVQSEPESFNGQACADPIEGPDYGRTTASVFLNVGTGKPMINSFAHGGMTYRLQHDVESVRKRLEVAGEDAATIVVALLVDTDLDATEEDELIRLAAGLSGRGLRPLQKDLTAAKAKKATDEKAAKRAHLMESATGRPVVTVRGGRLHEAVEQMDDAFAALEEPAVFQRNGLVRVIPVTASTATEAGIKLVPGTNRIKDVQEGDGRVVAMKHMEFQAIDEMGDPYPVDAPTDYVNAWRAMGAWKVPALRAISPCPIMRHDGSLEERGGYDRESMLYYGGGLKLNIPSKPDRTDALEALAVLLAPFEEFPLVTKGKPQKEDIDTAVLLSAILSLALRTQLKTSPLHGVLARTSRTGKGLLLEGICTLVTSANAVTLPPNEGSTDEQIAEEDRKRFTAVLRCGPAAANLDNIVQPLGSAPMNTLMTDEFWTDRVLSTSDSVTLPNSVQMFANGNNLSLKGDMVPRSVILNMDAGVERPELRTFAITDLIGHIHNHRPRLLSALFTILRAYRMAGRPGAKDKLLGRFETWSQEVAGCVRWLGYPDPTDSQIQLIANDEDRDTDRKLLHNWLKLVGEDWITTTALVRAVDSEFDVIANENETEGTDAAAAAAAKAKADEEAAALKAAAAVLKDTLCAAIKSRELHLQKLGHFLKKKDRVIAGGLKLEAMKNRDSVNEYRVIRVNA